MKDWARGKGDASPPGWTLELSYAEQFHVDPALVRKTVPLVWWKRWLLWNKAQASHDIWLAWQSGHADALTAKQQELRNWAMLEDY